MSNILKRLEQLKNMPKELSTVVNSKGRGLL